MADPRQTGASAAVKPAAAVSPAPAPQGGGAQGGVTLQEALARGTKFLRDLGIDAARLEMELIMARALGTNRLGLYMDMARTLSEEARAASREMLDRRRKREPLAYILGAREFYGLELAVGPAVLIPRPETELIVDAVLETVRDARKKRDDDAGPTPEEDAPLRIADIGTGSGAIAVALAHELRRRGIPFGMIATDVSAAALEVAAANAARHGLAEAIEFREGSLFDPLPGTFDFICSNPPYVGESERESLAPEVARWEPESALFSGPDGTGHIDALLAGGAERLNPGGSMLIEIGWKQGETVRARLAASPTLRLETLRPDLAGIPRVVHAKRRE